MTTKTAQVRRMLREGCWSIEEIAFWTKATPRRIRIIRWRDSQYSDGKSYGAVMQAKYRAKEREERERQ